MGYVETLFGHQDVVTSLDALRAETALSSGARDKTVRFWKIVEESQLVFRGGGKSKIREVLEGGMDAMDEDPEQQPREAVGERPRYMEGSIDCVAMLDESTFVSGGDSGFVSCVYPGSVALIMSIDLFVCGRRGRKSRCSPRRSRMGSMRSIPRPRG